MTTATHKDKVRVVNILSNSLANNNLINRLVKQDRYHLKRIEMLMAYLFEYSMKRGRVVISEDRSACALVSFRDQKKNNLNLFYHNLKLAFKVTGFDRFSEMLEIERYIRVAHNAVAGRNQIYHIRLWGVHSGFQKKGVGVKLLLEMLEESKLLGRTVFLETATEEMLAFYERFGLTVYHQIDLNGTVYMLKQNEQNN